MALALQEVMVVSEAGSGAGAMAVSVHPMSYLMFHRKNVKFTGGRVVTSV